MNVYFHLLSRDEIQTLSRPLSILFENREELLEHWFALYRRRFPDNESFSSEALAELYAWDLDELLSALLDVDMVRFAAAEKEAGRRMARVVPYAEVVAMLHLFEESCARVLERRAVPPVPADTYIVLDKVSHCRMILFADAYFDARDRLVSRPVSRGESARASSDGDGDGGFHGIVGSSPAIRKVIAQIRAASRGKGTVLIAGESGTGKELVARALHACSEQPGRPFIVVNCAALPPELIESELFGHRKGSFSGAHDEYLGLIRAAEGGTLFLDEVTEMALATQAKLLRVLQERVVRPVGATREIPVSVRVLASTNRSPEAAVQQGLLRQDLYYRLQAVQIGIPPLRRRLDDIPALVDHFIGLANERLGRAVEGMHERALQALMRHHWPGNVRELSNALEHSFAFGMGARISIVDLPEGIVSGAAFEELADHSSSNSGGAGRGPEARDDGDIPTVAAAEREALRKALSATGGNKLRAAKLLGISRHGLYTKLRKFGLS